MTHAPVHHDVRPDKEPVSIVAGTYGHPIHPILVTIPIGAWISSLVFDIASHVVHAGAAGYHDGADFTIDGGLIDTL